MEQARAGRERLDQRREIGVAVHLQIDVQELRLAARRLAALPRCGSLVALFRSARRIGGHASIISARRDHVNWRGSHGRRATTTQ
jgi:hypothetical protein